MNGEDTAELYCLLVQKSCRSLLCSHP
uniref:Uncharacterized protein n=1 Tax=Anguilla anguilla TaxID=7936 RepID=A0A0E9PJL2_ANGAN